MTRRLPAAAALLAAIAGCPGGQPAPMDGGPTLIVTVADAGLDAGPDAGDGGIGDGGDAGLPDSGCALALVPSGNQYVAACGSFNYGSGVAAAALGPTAAPDVVFWNVDELTPSPMLHVLLDQGDGGLAGGLASYGPFGSNPDGGSIVSVVAGDFDGDGRLDLAATAQLGSCVGCPPGGEVALLLGDGQGNLAAPRIVAWANQAYTVGFMGAQSLVAADFDGDGRTDLASVMLDDTAGGIAEHLLVFLSDGGILGPAASDYLLSQGVWQLSSAVAADFDGDGRPDIAVAARELYVLHNRGGGAFDGPTAYATELSVASWLAAGDFDGDGRIDLAVGNYLGAGPRLGPAIQLFLNDAEGGFTAGPVSILPADLGTYGGQLAAGDFDGDGRADVAAVCQVDGGPLIAVLPGLAGGGLGQAELFPCGLEDVSAGGAALIAAPLGGAPPALVVGAPRDGDNCTKVTALFPVCD
ncbi:MAG TPA: VCBS repeat-containing protein [Myxococcales bacterium]|nr:VCBS repeat-containing protein [Myxococcales bacterium]